MAHAIERLFATPKTTAVRPFKSSNMDGRITSAMARVERTLLSAGFGVEVDFDLFHLGKVKAKIKTKIKPRSRPKSNQDQTQNQTQDQDQNQNQDQNQRRRTGVSAPHLQPN
jgi:hypothetical protein